MIFFLRMSFQKFSKKLLGSCWEDFLILKIKFFDFLILKIKFFSLMLFRKFLHGENFFLIY